MWPHNVYMSKDYYFPNHLLIAMPTESDANFSRSVIYIDEHNEDGALGIILNKRLHINLGSVLDHLDIPCNIPTLRNKQVLMGGPAGQDQGFVLYEHINENNHKEIALCSTKEILEDIAADNGPDQFLVALGYAGWGPQQLEEEISENNWMIVEANSKFLFSTPIDKRWERAFELLGIDANKLSNISGNA